MQADKGKELSGMSGALVFVWVWQLVSGKAE